MGFSTVRHDVTDYEQDQRGIAVAEQRRHAS
jgi:hypothetical protein